MLVLRSFVRRLLVQALVSSIVMAGIQVAVRFGPPILPAGIRPVEADRQQAASTRTPEPEHRADAFQTGSIFVQDRTGADVKAGRFAVWRERETPAPRIAPERLASKGLGNGLSDVVLFDRCRPSCESRDPLLAFNQRPPTVPPTPAEPPVEEVDGDQTSSIASVATAETTDDAPRSGVATVAHDGLSWARRVVGTAGSAIGW